MVFLLLFLDVAPILATTDFPMKGLNRERTHFITNHDFPYTHAKVIASGNHLKGTYSAPIIENDIAYMISTETQRVLAYHLGREEFLWTSPFLLGGFSTHPANGIVVGDRLVIPAGSRIYVLNKHTGAVIKDFNTSSTNRTDRFASGPLHFRDGDVYIGSWNHNIYGFNVSNSSTSHFMRHDAGGVVSGGLTYMERGSNQPRLVVATDSWPARIIEINPVNKIVSRTTNAGNIGIAATGLTADGVTAYFMNKQGRLYRYNANTGALTNSASLSQRYGTDGRMIFAMAYNENHNELVVTMNRRSNNAGTVYRVNPSNGNFNQIYSSNTRVSTSPVVMSNNVIMFARSDGLIVARNRNGTTYNWHRNSSGSTSTFKMPNAVSFMDLTVGGGDKKVILAQGSNGINVFEPYLPNIRAEWIRAVDSSGTQRTTFTDQEQIRIQGSFWNNGVRSASNVEHRLRRNGSFLGTSHTITQSYNVNQRRTVTHTFNSLSAGTYTFEFRADPANKIKESDETDNNTETITITVTETRPDLKGETTTIVDESGSQRTEFLYGEPVTVRTSFKNIGDRSASSVGHTQFLNGTSQGNLSTQNYSINQTRTISNTYSNLEPGTYTVYGHVDPNNNITEWATNNNTTPTRTFTVTALPDLEAQRPTVTNQNGESKVEFDYGDMITVRGVIRNIGDSSAQNVETAFILNNRSQGVINTSNYTVNQSRTMTQTLSNLAPGEYTVQFRADPNNRINEMNKDNNASDVVTFSIKSIPMPNLPNIVGTNITVQNSDGEQKNTFTLNETVQIVGDFQNRGYSSTSNVEHVLRVEGTTIYGYSWNATTSLSTLSYNISQNRQLTINMTGANYLPRGSYRVYMEADPSRKIAMDDGRSRSTPIVEFVIKGEKPNAFFTTNETVQYGETIHLNNLTEYSGEDDPFMEWFKKPVDCTTCEYELFSTTWSPRIMLPSDHVIKLVASNRDGWSEYERVVNVAPRPIIEAIGIRAFTEDKVLDASKITQISTSNAHTLALRSNGRVIGWGFNGNGRIGDGTTINRNEPVEISGLENIIQVSAGRTHSMALRSDGLIFAWGNNGSGRIGDGTDIERHTPVQVQGISDVVQISAGGVHSLALKNDGSVWSWGSNGLLRLGAGLGEPASFIPVQVLGLDNIVQIYAATNYSLALRSDGAVFAWGSNLDGRLGVGDDAPTSRNAVQVNNLNNIIQISAGDDHALALRDDGSVFGWGNNEFSQIGDGTTTNRLSPVKINSLNNIKQVSAGGIHSLALRSDGLTFGFGGNSDSQLGDGTTSTRSIPIQINNVIGGTQVITGNSQSLILKNDNSISSFGRNTIGQLGNGTFTNSPIPVEVQFPRVIFSPNDNIEVTGRFQNVSSVSASGVEHSRYLNGIQRHSRLLRNYSGFGSFHDINLSLGALDRGAHTIKMTADPDGKLHPSYAENPILDYAIKGNTIEFRWYGFDPNATYRLEKNGEIVYEGEGRSYTDVDVGMSISNRYKVTMVDSNGVERSSGDLWAGLESVSGTSKNLPDTILPSYIGLETLGGIPEFVRNNYISNTHYVIDNMDVNSSSNGKNTIEFWMKWDGKDISVPADFRETIEGVQILFQDGYFGLNTFRYDIIGIPSSQLKNRWVHVAFVVPNGVVLSPDNVTMYLNGEKQNLHSHFYEDEYLEHSFRQIMDKVYLTTNRLGEANFTGKISEVRIWDHERTQNQVQNMMKQQVSGNENGLVGYVGVTRNSLTAGHNIDGTLDHYVLDNMPVNTASNGKNTVEFWMLWDGENRRVPIHTVGEEQNGIQIYFRDGRFGVHTWQQDILGIPSDHLKNRWVHVALVVPNNVELSSSNVTMYIDGEKQNLQSYFYGSHTTHGSRQIKERIFLTSNRNGNLRFMGGLSDVRIWNHERTQNQIRNEMHNRMIGNEPGLVGYVSPPTESISFDGTNSISFNVGFHNIVQTDFWMYWDGKDHSTVLSNEGGYNLQFHNGYFGFNTTNGDMFGIPSDSLKNKWVHVSTRFRTDVVTNAGIGNQLWINGISQELIQTQGTPANRRLEGLWTIGNSHNGTSSYSGKIGTFRLYTSNTLWRDEVFRKNLMLGPDLRKFETTHQLRLLYEFDKHTTDLTKNQSPYEAYQNVNGIGHNMKPPSTSHHILDEGVGVGVESYPNATYQLRRDGQLLYEGDRPYYFDRDIEKGNGYEYEWVIKTENGQSVAGKEFVYVQHDMIESLKMNDGNFIEVTNLNVNGVNNGKNTVEFWVKWDGSNHVMPVGFSSYQLIFRDGMFGFNTNRNNVLGIDSAQFKNQWVHIAAVFHNGVVDETSMRLYINGVEKTLESYFYGTWSTHASRTASSNFNIGKSHTHNTFFSGEISDVRIWNHERTEAQIRANMNEFTTSKSGLVGHWKLDATTTDQVFDQSSFSNNGNAQGYQPFPLNAQVTNDGVELSWPMATPNATFILKRDGTEIFNEQGINTFFDTNVEQGNTYTYTLEMVTGNGQSLITTKIVTVVSNSQEIDIIIEGSEPVADFTFTTPIYQREYVQFTNLTTEEDGDDVSYSWFFKDKNCSSCEFKVFSNEENPLQRFDDAGTYQIKLVAIDIDGESEQIRELVVLPNSIHAGFMHESPYYFNDTITITSVAEDENGFAITEHKYTITRPNGTTFTSTATNPSFVGNQLGEYRIVQEVKNSLGNTARFEDVVEVIPRDLTAGFIHDSPYYQGDTISIVSTAYADEAITSHHYQITRPDGTTFTTSAMHPSFNGNQLGMYQIVQTVTTASNQATFTDFVYVEEMPNELPVADFEVNPNPTDRITETQFINQSYDPDGDPLIYVWQKRKVGTSVWSTFSTAENPTVIFEEVGTYEVMLTVTEDNKFNEQDSIIKEVVVNNLAPIADFGFNQIEYYVGDMIVVTSQSVDPESDELSHLFEVTFPSGTVQEYSQNNASFIVNEAGQHFIKYTVTDIYGDSDSITKIVVVQDLSITGEVDHTPQWLEIHQRRGNLHHQFYSGETLILKAEITNYPANYVNARLTGRLINGSLYSRNVMLTKESDTIYVGAFDGEDFIKNYPLRQGEVSIDFEVQYTNGQIRTHTVVIEIIDNVLNAYNLHRFY